MLQKLYLLVDATTTTCDTDVDDDLIESINIKSCEATRISCSLLQFKNSNKMLERTLVYIIYSTPPTSFLFTVKLWFKQGHCRMDVDKEVQHVPRIPARTKSIYFI